MTAILDKALFFAAVRLNPFPGFLTPGQATGMEAMLDAAPPDIGLDALAYCFATAPIETGWTMLPVKEKGGTAYYTKMYDIKGSRPAKAKELGNVVPGDGALFCGRGLVQLTGRGNYAKLSARLRLLGYLNSTTSLVTTPDLAMHPDIAAAIMFVGMTEGLFTGRKLSDYFGPGKANALGARAIINGKDRAAEFELHWKGFQAALQKAGYKPGAVNSKTPVIPVEVKPISESAKMPEIKSNGEIPEKKPETPPKPVTPPPAPPALEPPKTLAEAIRRRIFGA